MYKSLDALLSASIANELESQFVVVDLSMAGETSASDTAVAV